MAPSFVSADTTKRLQHALGSQSAGLELVNTINWGVAEDNQATPVLALMITGTAVSSTTDFGGLLVGDKVVVIPTVAGNAQVVTVATVGTLPIAGVVGNLYLVLRTFTPPATVTTTL